MGKPVVVSFTEDEFKMLGKLIAEGATAKLVCGWFVPEGLENFLNLISDRWLQYICEYIDEKFEGVNHSEPEYRDWMRLKKQIEIELVRRVYSARKLDER